MQLLRSGRSSTKSEVSIRVWYGELHVCWLCKRVKVEIRDPERWNLTDRGMTALQPVLSLICRHHRLIALSFPLCIRSTVLGYSGAFREVLVRVARPLAPVESGFLCNWKSHWDVTTEFR